MLLLLLLLLLVMEPEEAVMVVVFRCYAHAAYSSPVTGFSLAVSVSVTAPVIVVVVSIRCVVQGYVLHAAVVAGEQAIIDISGTE